MKTPADSRGFTLIELMIVIAIIGILAAIALIVSSSYAKRAKVAEATCDIDTIYKALVLLETDTGQWPGHQTISQINKGGGNEVWDLSAAAAGLVSDDPGTPFPDWNGPYLPSVPKDPWGNPYLYRQPGRHNTTGYDLYSFGPDGQEGGGDDIDNWSEK